MIDLEAIGHDVASAYASHLGRKQGRRRKLRVAFVVAALAGVFATVAIASDIGADLQLDPTKWAILGGGSTDAGRGTYVHAKLTSDGSHSTFMVEHDAGLSPYEAFLLHERTKAAANATSPVPVLTETGPLCTPAQLTRAEAVAFGALSAFGPGTPPDVTRTSVIDAETKAFGDAACRGLEYGAEQAQLVYAGKEPTELLMPGVR